MPISASFSLLNSSGSSDPNERGAAVQSRESAPVLTNINKYTLLFPYGKPLNDPLLCSVWVHKRLRSRTCGASFIGQTHP